jgi:hypothetical protein
MNIWQQIVVYAFMHLIETGPFRVVISLHGDLIT